MTPRRRPPLEPSADNLRRVERLYAALGPPMRLLLRWWQQVEVVGREAVPRRGPLLVLSNHVAFFDPFTLMVALRRPIHMMAAEGLFDEPGLSLLARWSGAVPRKKRVTDAASVRRLLRWARVGGAVGLFPEGERTWDGGPLPLAAGIGRLVQAAGVPVVAARIVGGYRQHPRWADHQRRARIRVELDPPRAWGCGDDPAEIEGWLAARLRVDPAAGQGWPCRGSRLAEGLPNALYRCPACGQVDGLQARGDALRCAGCGRGWRLDVDHRLHPEEGGEAQALAELIAAQEARTRAEVEERAARSAPLLESGPMRLLDVTGDEGREVATGRLVLAGDELRVEASGEAAWRLPLAELASVDVFMARRLQVRTRAGAVFEAVLPDGSVLKWQRHVEALRGLPAGAAGSDPSPGAIR